MVGLEERAYPIRIEYGCLENIGDELARRHIVHRYCVIADETVAALYADTLVQSLQRNDIAVELVTFPAGEASKNLHLFAELCSTLARKGYDRKDGIIALGGGVTGDLAGFVAACYLRGIAFVQVPTTLLAQVDSSVGGKTGVDIAEGKNLVGAFYQPRAVYIDTAVLQTLADEEFGGGMAEVIKYGVIRDKSFFQYLRNEREGIIALDKKSIQYIIETCCRIKAEVVAEDEKESDVRRILNFGHTIGHAVEAVSNFTIIHGRAVAIGMVAASRIAVRKKLLARHECDEIIEILQEYDLPTEIPHEFDRNLIRKYLLTDKKSVAGKIAYILPRSIGEVIITDDVDDTIIDEVIA